MPGLEVLPIIKLVEEQLINVGLSLIDLEAESEALVMIATDVEEDIKDAIIFYQKLAKYVGEEIELKERANVAIEKAQKALESFEQHLRREGFREGTEFVLFERARVRRYLVSLQFTQSSLARRIDWMRSAISELARKTNP
ncbi:hypothetical protein NCS52_01281300 [Fusarium sp. LHS14.1]|nr:hypothetical protein NCS52_01281300 [Fusarium sp. LHS14.1]